MTALHVFDMDGTLLRGTTASIELSRRLDRLAPLADLEAGFAAERITAAEFAMEMRALWTELSLELVAEVVSASPWIEAVDPAGILEPADKVRLAEQERVAHGLTRGDCVAYGDSMSDLPLFGVLKNTVAVNGDEGLERVAAVAYRGGNLREAYALGRDLLGRRR